MNTKKDQKNIIICICIYPFIGIYQVLKFAKMCVVIMKIAWFSHTQHFEK